MRNETFQRLKGIADYIERQLDKGTTHDLIRSVLVHNHNAVEQFTGGSYQLRIAGVTGSCTTGKEGAMRSWLRCARRRLDREAVAQ